METIMKLVGFNNTYGSGYGEYGNGYCNGSGYGNGNAGGYYCALDGNGSGEGCGNGIGYRDSIEYGDGYGYRTVTV